MDPLGELVGWIAVYGAFGLFVVGVAERFLPMLPSYGLLLAVGASATEEAGLPWVAALLTASGGILGCAAWFYAMRATGVQRSRNLIHQSGWLFGLPSKRIDDATAYLQTNSTTLAFGLQLTPATRLIAPVLAALARPKPWTFLVASAAGITLWNSFFIAIGYVAASCGGAINATALGAAAVSILLVVQAAYLLAVRAIKPLSHRVNARNVSA